MAQEMDVEISPDGRVKVHIKGVKGRRCLEYVEVLKEVLGPVKSQKFTPEYYESEAGIHVEGQGGQA